MVSTPGWGSCRCKNQIENTGIGLIPTRMCRRADSSSTQATVPSIFLCGLHITDLPDDLLVLIFKRLEGPSVLDVCKTFKRIYYENATSIKVNQFYYFYLNIYSTASLTRCPKLAHVDASKLELDFYWPMHALTQLTALTIRVGTATLNKFRLACRKFGSTTCATARTCRG